MFIYVVIPGYNEEKYIGAVLKKVKQYTSNIVYVDDGSRDKSAQIARRYTDHVLVHESNLGKGAALRTACDYVFHTIKADAVVFMDADDQHDVAELPKFFDALQHGDQVVFGVRKFSPTTPMMKFLGNRLASVLLNVLFGRYIPDIPSGFKAMSKKGYTKLQWNSAGYEVETEIAVRVAKLKMPFSIIEIDAIYHDTEKGMTAIDAAHIARCLFQWRIGL